MVILDEAYMRRPTPMESFDALYQIAAADGRGDALFGNSIELARPAYERSLIGDGRPDAYLEFPLMGKPCFDILSVYGAVASGARFAQGAGFGQQEMFDWFSGVRVSDNDVSCGLEVDTSLGTAEQAGVYLQQRSHIELVEPFLASVGEQARSRSYLDVLARLPKGWKSSYVGLFPGRSGTPLRIGGYMVVPEQGRCAAGAAHLEARFRRIGFTAYDAGMLEACSALMRLAPSVDFQFDILTDGILGSTFGLSLSFNQVGPRKARECMESGYGAALLGTLQGWGLADERWRLIADAAFARSVGFWHDDGSEGRLALCVLFNYAKVKFVNGNPQPAKFYLTLKARELLPAGDRGGHRHVL